jgi:hypothetical protein
MIKRKLLNLRSVGPLVAVALVATLLVSGLLVAFGNGEDSEAGAIYRASKNTTSIKLTMSSSDTQTNRTMHADGLLAYSSGISYAYVSLKVTLPDGKVTIPTQGSSTMTDRNGRFSIDYVPKAVGNYVFTATYAGNYKYLSSYASHVATAQQNTSSVTSQAVRWTWQDSPTSVVVGQSYTYSIKFEMKTTSGVWVGASNVGIKFAFQSPSGATTVLNAATSSSGTGIGSVSFTPDVAGTWTVVCDWDHSNPAYAQDSSPAVTINAAPYTPPTPTKQTTAIQLSGSSTVQTGSALSVTGTLKTTGGAAIAGATVSVQVINPDGSRSATTTATTNANGNFAYVTTPSAAGSYTVSATYAGDESHTGAASSLSFTASAPAPPPTTSYDYIVSGSQVKDHAGTVAYTGSNFLTAVNWALSSGNKVVYVPAGTYSVGGTIMLKTGDTLVGDGDSTVFNFVSRGQVLADNVDRVTMKSFKVTGSGNVMVASTSGTHGGHVLQDITVYQVSNTWAGAVMTYVQGSGTVLNDVKFIRVKAIDCRTYGFLVNGDFTGQWTKNLYFEGCVASWNGVNGTTNEWAPGFDLAEGTNVDTMTLVNCVANDNLESGFHFEDAPQHLNVVFKNCVASNNGIHKQAIYGHAPLYGAGFFMGANSKQSTISGLDTCTGAGNTLGLIRYDTGA